MPCRGPTMWLLYYVKRRETKEGLLAYFFSLATVIQLQETREVHTHVQRQDARAA